MQNQKALQPDSLLTLRLPDQRMKPDELRCERSWFARELSEPRLPSVLSRQRCACISIRKRASYRKQLTFC
jgi:hypothetical protein